MPPPARPAAAGNRRGGRRCGVAPALALLLLLAVSEGARVAWAVEQAGSGAVAGDASPPSSSSSSEATPPEANASSSPPPPTSSSSGSSSSKAEEVVSRFMGLLSNPFDVRGAWFPKDDARLAAAGVGPELRAAAGNLRTSLRNQRQQLLQQGGGGGGIIAGLASAFRDAAAAGSNASSSSLPPPSVLATDSAADTDNGTAAAAGSFLTNTAPTRLAALVGWLAQEGQRSLDALRTVPEGAAALEALRAGSAAGRKLLAAYDDAAAAGGDDAASSAALPSMSARADLFLELFADAFELGLFGEEEAQAAEEDTAAATGKGRADGDAGATDGVFDDDADEGEVSSATAASRRRLQQAPNGDYVGGYANAVRFIFSNAIDFFRAGGLYYLAPLIADLRGLLTRYNWIRDLLDILDAPLENFVNANLYPLPQTNDEAISQLRAFLEDYCKFESADPSVVVLGKYEGPVLEVKLLPVECPVYADVVTGRQYVSFADCVPAVLVVNTYPLRLSEAYLAAAEYESAECKYEELLGTDVEVNIGGGNQVFTFRFSAQGIDIVPTVIQIDPQLNFGGVATADNAEDGEPGAVLTSSGSSIVG